jgi:hypothetical protein
VDESTPLLIAESTLGAQDLLTDILRNGAESLALREEFRYNLQNFMDEHLSETKPIR